MADEDKRPDEVDPSSDPRFEEDVAPQSDPEFETDEPAHVSSGDAQGSDAAELKVESVDSDTSDETQGDEFEDEDTMAASVAEVVAAVTATGGDPHGTHGTHDSHGGHLGHVAPMSVLIGVLAALILLTILTVGVTAVDLGSQGNFVVAMIIATVKAVLVMGYFMHLFWDSKFNIVAFGSSFLFAALFFAMAFLDRSENQGDIDAWEADHPVMQP